MEAPILQIVLTSAITATIISGVFQLMVWFLNRDKERYEKLYGSLRYKLMAMRALTKNYETISKEIINDQQDSTKDFVRLLNEHGDPLVKKWYLYKDEIRELFEKYSGYIREEDFDIVEDFIDACTKCDIAENDSLKSIYSAKDNRAGKIFEIITKMQDKFMKTYLLRHVLKIFQRWKLKIIKKRRWRE